MLHKKNIKAWVYLAPAIIFLCVFTLFPLINTLLTSFQESYSFYNPFSYGTLSLNNYIKLFQWNNFITSIKNTFLIVFITVPLSTIISLLIALGLNSIKPLKKVFQTIFFLPYVTNAIALGMVFTVLFSFTSSSPSDILGVINYIIVNVFNQPAIDFLGGTSYWAGMTVLLTYVTWNGLAFKILIFLSGLQNIDKKYYQAAKIDNATKSQIFFKITIPLLSPILSYVLITSLISAFKEYSAVVALFGQGTQPSYDFGTIVSFINRYYNDVNFSQFAATAAVVLLVIISIFTAINMYISKKKVHY